MDTYKIDCNREDFEQILSAGLKNVKNNEIGFMYNNSGVYVRSINSHYIDIIRNEYSVEACEQPANVNDDYRFAGNSHLFETKLY